MPLREPLRSVPRPPDDAPRDAKKNYAQKLADSMALTLSREIAARGVEGCKPDPTTGGGTERRIAGGIGAKKVDVSFARENLGLVFGISIKAILSPDASAQRKSGGKIAYFGKNLQNRKGEMLAESTTLHKRFPFAVLGGLFLLDERAKKDNEHAVFENVDSTYARAHRAFAPFVNRVSHADADEKFDLFAIGLCSAAPPRYELHLVGEPARAISLEKYLDRLLTRVAELNSDYFDYRDGKLVDLSRKTRRAGGRGVGVEAADLLQPDDDE